MGSKCLVMTVLETGRVAWGRNRLCFLFTSENFLLLSTQERPLCSVGSLFEGVKCQGGEGIESDPRERNIPNLYSLTRVLEGI